MKLGIQLMVFSGLVMLMSACGTEEDWANEDVIEAVESQPEVGTEVEALTAVTRTLYTCKCELDASPCPVTHPFAVPKQNTCRYDRRADVCLGRCNGQCVTQNSKVYQGLELAGQCIKKKVHPRGNAGAILTDCEGQDLACIVDSESDEDVSIYESNEERPKGRVQARGQRRAR
ncbi:MAG: hypothetical protein VX589_16305 [Myxococcota bacterium]|nr:hypothetical protein [Myxococcota bacterium]